MSRNIEKKMSESNEKKGDTLDDIVPSTVSDSVFLKVAPSITQVGDGVLDSDFFVIAS